MTRHTNSAFDDRETDDYGGVCIYMFVYMFSVPLVCGTICVCIFSVVWCYRFLSFRPRMVKRECACFFFFFFFDSSSFSSCFLAHIYISRPNGNDTRHSPSRGEMQEEGVGWGEVGGGNSEQGEVR